MSQPTDTQPDPKKEQQTQMIETKHHTHDCCSPPRVSAMTANGKVPRVLQRERIGKNVLLVAAEPRVVDEEET